MDELINGRPYRQMRALCQTTTWFLSGSLSVATKYIITHTSHSEDVSTGQRPQAASFEVINVFKFWSQVFRFFFIFRIISRSSSQNVHITTSTNVKRIGGSRASFASSRASMFSSSRQLLTSGSRKSFEKADRVQQNKPPVQARTAAVHWCCQCIKW